MNFVSPVGQLKFITLALVAEENNSPDLPTTCRCRRLGHDCGESAAVTWVQMRRGY